MDEQESNDAAQRQALLRALAQDQIKTQSQQSQAPIQPQQRPATSSGERRAASPSARGGFAALVSGKRPARGGRKRIAVISFIVVALIAVAIGVGAAMSLLQARRTPPAPTVVRIDTMSDGLTCGVQSTAWSPDSALLAVSGGTGCSSSDGNHANEVILYDAHSGKVMQRLRPDDVVYHDEAVSSAIDAARKSLGYTGGNDNGMPDELGFVDITWTPDGRALLMMFGVSVPPPASGVSASVNGMLRLGVTTSSPSQVWVDKIKYQQNGFGERWDLTAGTSSLVPLPKAATAYSWKSDGSLAAADATTARIGTADGGQTFSIWQSGIMNYLTPWSSQSPSQPVAPDQYRIEWGAILYPVSPDGRYVYTYFPAFGELVPPSTGAALPSMPQIKPHDQALLAQAQRMTQSTPATNSGGYLAAYRPDGRRVAVAALVYGNGTPVPSSSYIVTLYDAASGKLIGHLTPVVNQPEQPNSPSQEMLSWSPDGKRLMMSESGDNAITIWEPGALPA